MMISEVGHRIVDSEPESLERIYTSIPEAEVEYFFGFTEPLETGSFSGSSTAWTESSALEVERIRKVSQNLRSLFGAAKEYNFENGTENDFSRKFVEIVERHGDVAVKVFANLLDHNEINPGVAAEALRWLGYMGDGPFYVERRWLLAKALFSLSPRIRDAAALGLSSLDDPYAIRYIEKAIQREENAELRQDLQLVLEDLKELI